MSVNTIENIIKVIYLQIIQKKTLDQQLAQLTQQNTQKINNKQFSCSFVFIYRTIRSMKLNK